MYMGFGIPFGILVMRGFFRRIPRDVVEAALIDGCSWFTIYARVIMPLALPAVASLLILDGNRHLETSSSWRRSSCTPKRCARCRSG